MKIKSMAAATMIAISGLYAGSSFAQVQGLPIIGGLLSGDLGGGGIPVIGSLGGGGIPIIGSLSGGGIPEIGSLSGGGLPGLEGLPFLSNLDGLVPPLPGFDGIINVAAVPGIVPGLLTDLPRSLGRNAGAAPGLLALGTSLTPLQSVSTLTGIGGNLGVGALYSLVPVLEVATTNPSTIVEYLLGSGTILSQFGALGDLPAIPVVTAPLGLGFGEDIPIIGGLGTLTGGGFGL